MKNAPVQVSGLLVAVALLSSCAAQPGPAPVEDVPTGVAAETSVVPEVPVDKQNRDEIVVGIDPVRGGFNPHLLSDDSAFVQSMAELVLPSAFANGNLNTDLLKYAHQVDPSPGAAQTVEYQISGAAQWSDGSPITGADFQYLWTNLKYHPGAINSAGYRAIEDIRSLDSGKKVIVDFSTPVANWQQLFRHLLPSHLFSIGTESFEKVLATSVPASGGRYMVRVIDRRRGVIELARNDRFWGEMPAAVELLSFREIASVTQAIEMTRNNQLGFSHVTPSETAMDSLRLSGLQTRTVDRAVHLEAVLNHKSLSNVDTRRAIASALDVPMIAKIAAGRSAELPVSEDLPAVEISAEDMRQAQENLNRPIKIAADPANDYSKNAAVAISDMLRAAGFQADVVLTDSTRLTASKLPKGEVDISVVWRPIADDILTAASQLSCPLVDGAQVVSVGSNLAQYCNQTTEATLQTLLADAPSSESISKLVGRINKQEILSVPILKDRRIDILGTGIVGPAPILSEWPTPADSSVLSTAYMWKEE